MNQRTHFVYRCYDTEGRCLYVGCTNDLRRRMSEHRYNESGADLATSIKAIGPLPRAQARAMEKEYAAKERPLYGLTPERQRLIARGEMRFADIYPPHRRALVVAQ